MATNYLSQPAAFSSKEEWQASLRAKVAEYTRRLRLLKAEGITSGAEVQILKRHVSEAKRLLKR